MKRKNIHRINALILALMLALSLAPMLADTAHAEGTEKTSEGLSLGVSALNNPQEGAGGWSKVYYGSAKETPLRFNVLNKNETVFSNASTPTLLLDCDSIVRTGHAGNSQIYEWGQIAGTFESIGQEYLTEAEHFALFRSRKPSATSDDLYPFPDENNKEYEFDGLGGSGSYVFTLDASELMNKKYGFPANMSATDLRKKTGGAYWVRSRNGGTNASYVGCVKSDGGLGKQMYNTDAGFSPTTNVDLSRILFTSLISGTAGQAGVEYKLTIIDDKRKDSSDLRTYFKTEVTGAITRDGDVITIPFKVSGNRAANATQVSVLITDKPWNTEGAQILKYGKLNVTSGSVTGTGTGTFELPESCYRSSSSGDYCAYVFAEDVNDGNFTDFASPPVTLTVPAAKMKVTATPYEGEYNGAAHGIGLEITPGGISSIATIKYGNTEGTYDLDAAPKRTKVGEQTVYYQVSADGFDTVTGSAKIKITPKTLTVIDAKVNDKVYDGDTSATFAYITLQGTAAVDDISATATGTFSDKNVGNGKTVNISDYELTGDDKDNYKLAESGHVTTTTASITPKSVSVSGITADDKIYDGNTDATVNTDDVSINGVVSGDSVTLADGTTGSFANKDAGLDKTVYLSGMSLGGADAGNYALNESQTTTTASINQKPLIISGVKAEDRDYDGTTIATLDLTSATISGIIGDEDVTIHTDSTGTFDNKNADSNKTVTIDLYITGDDVSNYTIDEENSQKTATASIFRRPVKITGVQAEDKDYDGTTKVELNDGQFTLDGKVDGDDLNATATAAFDDKNVGTGKNVSISRYVLTGADQGNYMVSAESQKETSADIRMKMVSVSIPTTEKVYDGTTDAPAGFNIADAVVEGLVDGEDVSVASASAAYEDPNAGDSKVFKLSNLTYTGSDMGNYELPTSVEITGKITKKGLTVTGITAKDKDYDGKTDAELVTDGMEIAGVLPDDEVTVTPSGKFENASVGNGKKVNITYALSGGSAGNYTVDTASSQMDTKASITGEEPKPTPTPAPAAKAKAVLVAKGIASGKKAVNISWNNVGADRYVIYMSRCNYNGKKYKFKQIKVVNGQTFKMKKSKLKGKTAYKFYVVAQKKSGGSYVNIAKSAVAHFFTGNLRGRYTNPKKLKLKKTAFTLSKGKSATIKGTVTKARRSKRLATSHAKLLRFTSNNPAVATVNAKGKVTAKSKGTAVIYVQTINGIWKTCKVTVR